MRRTQVLFVSFSCLALLGLSEADGRQLRQLCGSYGERWREEVSLHRRSLQTAQIRSRKAPLAAVAGQQEIGGMTVRPDVGQIAIIDDADGVVARRNPFSLDRQMLRLIPVAPSTVRYQFDVIDGGFEQAGVDSGSLLTNLGDDDSRQVTLPFPFPYFGVQHRTLFVNSDGNLTFTEGDAQVTDRSLGRLLAGPPRIAALFRDLDPTQSRTGVRILNEPGRFVVTWAAVPEYRDSGVGPLQTFQIKLYPDGRIEMAFAGVASQDAITGISPGQSPGNGSVLRFIEGSTQQFTGAVAERFSSVEEVDVFTAAQKFYRNHEDAYDYLAFYNTLALPAGQGTVAFEISVRSDRAGIAAAPVDVGAEAGSRRRLQAVMNLGPLTQYPDDPDGIVSARVPAGDTPVTTLAHEVGHLFLAYASVRNPGSANARPMLGAQNAHWNFTFNSEASLLEGNRIQDNGANANPRFSTVATVEGYSPLDQYLMGLRAPNEVPDLFLVQNPSTSQSFPQAGVQFNGTRRDIRLDEIIQAEGRRTPDHTVSQRRFRLALVLITGSGQEPAPADLAKAEAFRSRFEQYFARYTNDRAAVDTSLKRTLRLSLFPASGVVEGSRSTATIRLEQPTATALTVLLRSRSGSTQLPASVTIPAGATSASFTVSGLRRGVDEITAEPNDPAFEAVQAQLQVLPAGELRLVVAGGDRQTVRSGAPLALPVRFRATDLNNLPYPGVAVQLAATAGGVIAAPSAETDENGIVAVTWTPGAGSLNELRATISGGASATASAIGTPAVAANGIVNAASFAPGLSPGGIATLYGVNLADGSQAGAQITVGGRAAAILYASPRQLNFLVSSELPVEPATLVVRNAAGETTVPNISVQALQPGIFFDTASGFGAILVAGTGQTTTQRPASPGQVLEIYCTGLGPLELSASGLRVTTNPPQVLIGGQTAEVLFSGGAPGIPGLYQVNARIPAGLNGGAQTAVVVSGAARSNEVRLQVAP